MENLDFDRGHGRNFDHLTMVILKFWPWSLSKIFDHMTMTPKWSKNRGRLTPPPPNNRVNLDFTDLNLHDTFRPGMLSLEL